MVRWIRELADQAGGIARDECVRCDVSRHDTACGHNGTRSDSDSWQHKDTGSQPRAVSNDDRVAGEVTGASSAGSDLMAVRDQSDEGPDRNIVSDLSSGPDVGPLIDEGVVADDNGPKE